MIKFKLHKIFHKDYLNIVHKSYQLIINIYKIKLYMMKLLNHSLAKIIIFLLIMYNVIIN